MRQTKKSKGKTSASKTPSRSRIKDLSPRADKQVKGGAPSISEITVVKGTDKAS